MLNVGIIRMPEVGVSVSPRGRISDKKNFSYETDKSSSIRPNDLLCVAIWESSRIRRRFPSLFA